MAKLEPVDPVVVFSPHLDDAVLSCAHFLQVHASPTVVTVLAGAPEVFHEGYNSTTTGKPYAPDAVKVRRDEDANAMELLGATPIWLDLLDGDYVAYRPSKDYREAIQIEIARVLKTAGAKSVIAPLGLIHPDHIAVSDACAALATEGAYEWYFYMDQPYGVGNRRAVWRRLGELRQQLRVVSLDRFERQHGIKQRAMSLYESQYEPTRHNYTKAFDATMRGRERYWQAKPRR